MNDVLKTKILSYLQWPVPMEFTLVSVYNELKRATEIPPYKGEIIIGVIVNQQEKIWKTEWLRYKREFIITLWIRTRYKQTPLYM